MEQLFRTVGACIADNRFEELYQLPVTKPGQFNWVQEVFEQIHVADTPDAPALIWTDGTETLQYSFLEISKKCNCFLNFLRSEGMSSQDVILTQLSLQPVNWIAILATIKGGFRMIPAATILSVQDIVYRFKTLLPKVVIADPDNAPKIDEAEQLSGSSIAIKIIAEGERSGWTSLAEIEAHSDIALAADTRADDPLFLFFTSGTTGLPKVVIHTQLSYPFGHLTTASWIGLKQGDVHYNISQPGWAKFTWSSFFAPWSVGAAIFTFQQKGRFTAHEQLVQIEKHRITTFCAPPTVLRMLILEDLKAYRFSFRQCVAAGEPLNPEVIEIWKQGTGMTIRDGFGQTESSCMIANLPGSKVKYGSMGKPTFLYDIVIADEHGREMPANEEGSIAVRTNTGKPNGIFADYFQDPEKRKEVFKHDLYYTGDKAYKDEDGYIWFVGRDDDVIKTSDYRVGPFEVESILIEHAAVIESAVVGSPHEIKGFEVKAFVVLDKGLLPTEALAHELFTYARHHLAPYKMPRIIEFVTELPKTISGKIRRVELRAAEAVHKTARDKRAQEYFMHK